jgi:cell wall-associated NlpC family hydrolase
MPGGVRSARDLLASRLPNTNAVPAPVAPASQSPLRPPMGAPAAAPTAPTPAAPGAAPVAPGGTGGVGDPQGAIPGNIIGGGGDWSQVNQWDPQINAAAAKYGVDPSRLKAMMVVESGGDPNAQGAGGAYGLMQVKGGYDANGNCYAWQCFADQNGLGNLQTDPQAQLNVAAAILAGAPGTGGTPGDEQGNFLNIYYPIPGGGVGESGNTQQQYLDALSTLMPLIQAAGGTGAPLNKTTIPGTTSGSGSGAPTSGPMTGTASPIDQPTTAQNSGVTDPNGQAIVDFAKQYLGTPYVTGQIGEGGPSAGWDCSGYVWWVAQQKGYTDVPHGSHYQYQWAQQNGTLQTQGSIGIGDMVFFATLPQGSDCSDAAGSNGCYLNAATHVGIYAGKDADGNDIFLNALNPSVGTIQSTLAEMGNPQILGWAPF